MSRGSSKRRKFNRKDSTITAITQAGRLAKEYFGVDRPLNRITSNEI